MNASPHVTEYLNLTLSLDESGRWTEISRTTARIDGAGFLVAVPARSWRPVTVTVASVVKVSLDREKA